MTAVEVTPWYMTKRSCGRAGFDFFFFSPTMYMSLIAFMSMI